MTYKLLVIAHEHNRYDYWSGSEYFVLPQLLELLGQAFCSKSFNTLSFIGFRLNATVLEVRNVSSKMACMDDCFAHPCCRSMNYNHAASADHSNKCEFLHDLVENTSHVLEPNSSFDHIFFSQPLKVIANTQFSINYENSRACLLLLKQHHSWRSS